MLAPYKWWGMFDKARNIRIIEMDIKMSVAELLLYNMRHVQEHAAQLSLLLGQQAGLSSSWVAQA